MVLAFTILKLLKLSQSFKAFLLSNLEVGVVHFYKCIISQFLKRTLKNLVFMFSKISYLDELAGPTLKAH